MTIQIAVRLPEDLVSFLDQSVAAGDAPSRAALVVAALEREQRARAALHDVEILRARGTSDDLDGLVEWTATHIDPDGE